MLPRRPPFLDPHFQRVARRLQVLELMSDQGSLGDVGDPDLDVGLAAGEPGERSHTHFLDFYSKDGLLFGMKAYGIHDRLVAMGFDDYELKVSREDSFHHRLQLFAGDPSDKEHEQRHRIMDLRVHLRQVAFKAEGLSRSEASFPVLVVEWLSMQNPRGSFSAARPRLPGQVFPGTGLGRAMHNLLVIMAQRTRREALLNVPEHFHLAVLYQRGGYRFPTLDKEHELEAALEALDDLSFAAAAWAVHRGFLLEETDAGEVPWRYEPVEMMLPLSSGLKRRLPGLLDRLAETFKGVPQRRFVVDKEGLARSLREDPVEGVTL